MSANDLADLTDELAGAELWVASLRANVRNNVTTGYSVESATELADLLEVLHDAVYARDELLREQAEQLDTLRNAVEVVAGRYKSGWVHSYLTDALAAAGGGAPEEGA